MMSNDQHGVSSPPAHLSSANDRVRVQGRGMSIDQHGVRSQGKREEQRPTSVVGRNRWHSGHILVVQKAALAAGDW